VSSESLVFGRGTIAVARRVGPTAWTVLTALAIGAERVDGTVIARASVRSLAANLGLNKDTVARALARLRQAGLVVHTASPFELGTYRVTVPPDVIGVAPEPGVDVAPRRRPLTVGSSRQLTLLESD
jgi:DNA-binding IclR family transcriptional regulator